MSLVHGYLRVTPPIDRIHEKVLIIKLADRCYLECCGSSEYAREHSWRMDFSASSIRA